MFFLSRVCQLQTLEGKHSEAGTPKGHKEFCCCQRVACTLQLLTHSCSRYPDLSTFTSAMYEYVVDLWAWVNFSKSLDTAFEQYMHKKIAKVKITLFSTLSKFSKKKNIVVLHSIVKMALSKLNSILFHFLTQVHSNVSDFYNSSSVTAGGAVKNTASILCLSLLLSWTSTVHWYQ